MSKDQRTKGLKASLPPDNPSGIPEGEALEASELRYRRLFETAKDGILILDAETGMVVDVNPFLIELLGFSREEFLGKAVWELGFFKDIVANKDNFSELQQEKYIRYEDKPLETFDGRRVDVEFVSNVYLVDHHRVIQCNIRDITERKRSAKALKDNASFLNTLLDAIPAPVFFKGTDGRYAGVNKAFESFYGKTRDELVGKSVFDVAPHELAEVYHARDLELFQNPGVQVYEAKMKDGQGVMHDVVYHKATFTDAGGKVIGLIGVILDITERVRAEEDHARLATAVEQSVETIMITDANGTILYANPAFEKITGYTCKEAIGQTPRILKSGKQDAEFYRRMWSVLTAGEVWRGNFINKRKDGSLYEEEASISPVRDGAGKIINYVATKRDITHEAQLEGQLRQTQKMEAVGRLAGGVAHDFNNLLMGIMGYADLCRDQVEAGHPIREWLDEITRDAHRSAEITRQLLAFARKQAIVPRILDLNDAVAGMLKLLRRLIGEDIHLGWLPGADIQPVRIDPSQIDQILANLCINARDAIAGVGKITLETTNITIDADYCDSHVDAPPGKYVLLVVSDNGCGMDHQTLEHIFEPFFTTKGIGTGLGLATVYGIVKQNNGCIYAYSEPGKGSSFKIYLPQVSAQGVETTPASPEVVPRGRGETVLLAEDEKSLRVTCGRFLETSGYKVLLAETPAEALELAAGYPGEIQLLLTDVVMPGMDGVQLAQRLSLTRPGLKVLYMSGYTSDVMAQRGVLEGGKLFIAKPFGRNDLARKVHEVLELLE